MNFSKNIKTGLLISVSTLAAILVVMVLAGMYKFTYLSGKPGYDVMEIRYIFPVM
jgi:hypothetical protein